MLNTTIIMNKDKKMKLAKRLIDEKINETINRWKDEDLITYAWGWRNESEMSSNHEGQFFYIEEVQAIAKALGLNITITVGPNLDGNPTPYIGIF